MTGNINDLYTSYDRNINLNGYTYVYMDIVELYISYIIQVIYDTGISNIETAERIKCNVTDGKYFKIKFFNNINRTYSIYHTDTIIHRLFKMICEKHNLSGLKVRGQRPYNYSEILHYSTIVLKDLHKIIYHISRIDDYFTEEFLEELEPKGVNINELRRLNVNVYKAYSKIITDSAYLVCKDNVERCIVEIMEFDLIDETYCTDNMFINTPYLY